MLLVAQRESEGQKEDEWRPRTPPSRAHFLCNPASMVRRAEQNRFVSHLLKLQQHDNLRHSLSAAVGSRAWRMGTTVSTLASGKKKPRQ